MVILENLHPLPVSDEEISLCDKRGETGFVDESKVRQMLVGPLTPNRHPARYHGHDGGFAGRIEFHESPFMRIAAEEEQEGKEGGPVCGEERVATSSGHRASPPRTREGDPDPPAATRRWPALLVMLVIGGLIGLGLHVLTPSTPGESDSNPPARGVASPGVESSLASGGGDHP